MTLMRAQAPGQETPAHNQSQSITLLRHYPAHEPRASDPWYPEFEQVRAKLVAQGLMVCHVKNADCAGDMQLHHKYVEFAYQNAVDPATLDRLLGLSLTGDDLAQWVESEANLVPLCEAHHVGAVGIHMIPAADWTIIQAAVPGFEPVIVQRSNEP